MSVRDAQISQQFSTGENTLTLVGGGTPFPSADPEGDNVAGWPSATVFVNVTGQVDIQLQQSVNGTDWDKQDIYSMQSGVRIFPVTLVAQYFRVIVGGIDPSSDIRVQTIYQRNRPLQSQLVSAGGVDIAVTDEGGLHTSLRTGTGTELSSTGDRLDVTLYDSAGAALTSDGGALNVNLESTTVTVPVTFQKAPASCETFINVMESGSLTAVDVASLEHLTLTNQNASITMYVHVYDIAAAPAATNGTDKIMTIPVFAQTTISITTPRTIVNRIGLRATTSVDDSVGGATVNPDTNNVIVTVFYST